MKERNLISGFYNALEADYRRQNHYKENGHQVLSALSLFLCPWWKLLFVKEERQVLFKNVQKNFYILHRNESRIMNRISFVGNNAKRVSSHFHVFIFLKKKKSNAVWDAYANVDLILEQVSYFLPIWVKSQFTKSKLPKRLVPFYSISGFKRLTRLSPSRRRGAAVQHSFNSNFKN